MEYNTSKNLSNRVSDLNSDDQLPRPGDRRNFDTQQDLEKKSTNWHKAYRNKLIEWYDVEA